MSTVSKAAGRPTTNTDSKTPSPPTMITAGSTPTSLELNDTKAGMTGLDKDKINKIIAAASKGSRFYKHAQEKEKQLQMRIDKMLEERAKLTAEDIAGGAAEVDVTIAELEHSRITSQHIVHVDMDAFYAAVEMRDNPALRNVPLGVGSMSMLSTSNYIARKYGVRAAMPGFIAKKLCPGLVIVPGNHAKYKVVSEQVVQVIKTYTSSFSMASLDEGYCDFTEYTTQHTVCKDKCPLHGSSVVESPLCEEESPLCEAEGALCWCEQVAVVQNGVNNMRSDIFTATQLTASAGISCNTFLAKVCSDINKPNGQYYLPPDRDAIIDFISVFEAKKAPGIGRVQAALLTALGVHRISDIVPNRGTLACLFSTSTVQFYLSIALGLGSTRIGVSEQRKSLSTETTFTSSPLNTRDTLTNVMLTLVEEQCCELAEGLGKEDLKGETVSIKVKLDTFVVIQRSKTLDHGVCSKEEILLHSRSLLEHLISQHGGKTINIRLLGIRVHNFVSEVSEVDKQCSILSFVNKGEKEVDQWQCPICAGYYPKKLNSFNKHVDKCTGEGLESSQESQSSTIDVPTLPSKAEGGSVQSISEWWTCPICKRSLAPQLMSFNKHVDKCLGEDLIVSFESEPSKIQYAPLLSEERHVLETEDLPRQKLVDRIPDNPDNHSRPITIPNEDSFSNAAKEEKQGTWECPICSKVLPPQLSSFNRHVDVCLGLTAGVPGPPNDQPSQKKRKHKGGESENSLKKFFRSI